MRGVSVFDGVEQFKPFGTYSMCAIVRADKGGRMTPNQYRAAIAALGLSQEGAGRWLGISPRASQGYALGEYPVPEPTAKLLRLVIRLKLKPEDVR